MAKAHATCTCARCGKQWTAEATKNNRKDADAWAEWAAENYTVCPECYHEFKKSEQEEKEQKIYDKYVDVLPEITNGSEKQIKYADDLRRKYIANNEIFIRKMQALLQNYNPTTVETAAASKGMPVDVFWHDWLDSHWLSQANAVLTLSDAGKLIEILAY